MNKDKEIKVGKEIERLIHQELDSRLTPLENEIRFYSDRLQDLDAVLSDLLDAYGKVHEIEAGMKKISEITQSMSDLMNLEKSIEKNKGLAKTLKEKSGVKEVDLDIERAKQMAEEAPVSTEKVGETLPKDKGKPEWEDVEIGKLEKGEKRIWRYGTHTLKIWREKDSDMAQVDDLPPEFIHRDRDFQRVKKKVMKMKQ